MIGFGEEMAKLMSPVSGVETPVHEEPGGIEPKIFVFLVSEANNGVLRYFQFKGEVEDHGVSNGRFELPGRELLCDGFGIVLPV